MIIEKDNYRISLLDSFDSEYERYEIKCKGYYTFNLIVDNESYEINLYDLVRFRQDVEEELKYETYYHQKNLILVDEVSLEKIIEISDDLVKKGLENMSMLKKDSL